MTAMPTLAPRLTGIHSSPASVLRRRARELRAAGRDIIELSSGNLDFATPDYVIAAALPPHCGEKPATRMWTARQN